GLAWLWHEEIKCLFLKYRDPPSGAIESLITKIFKYDLYSNKTVEIICHLKRILTDFCNKFNQRIVTLVNDFKKKQLGEQTLLPLRSDLNEFITQEVTEQILQKYLNSTNVDKIKRCKTIDQLIKLIKKPFKISFNTYDTKAIKRLDYLMIGCKISSRSGKNIVLEIFLTINSNNNHI
ncbi:4917_t:CDS:1, partial [Cetraspora pellucida]